MNHTIQIQLQGLITAVQTASTADELLQATEQLAASETLHPDPAALRCLTQILTFNNPGAAVAAVDGLIRLGEPAVSPLLASLDAANYSARAWAVRALAGIGDVRGLEVLENALATDIGPSVRRAAARGLGTLKLENLELGHREQVVDRALVALESGGSDPEWVVRYAVAVGLESLAGQMSRGSSPWRRSCSTLVDLAQPRSEAVTVVRLRAQLALRRLEAGS